MKFATHVLLFGQEKWIMRNIANAYPHVDQIYIAYSPKPWTYNPNARSFYNKPFNFASINQSPYIDKITVIEGEWPTEEAQRNACVNRAVKDGMDYLFIHDADEFYFHDAFEALKTEILNRPDIDFYKVPWICFWKSFQYCLVGQNSDPIVGYPEFAINLKRGIRFESKRRPNSRQSTTLSAGICYHGSYVLTNQELLDKINTWGHTNDFNKEQWFNEKWLKWTENMTNLHLVTPPDWKQAVKFEGTLPEVIADLR